jgi:2-polyprenyl-3-methyl-5-hydroxy-6-metoxy-1,4-benzoquinol methylase
MQAGVLIIRPAFFIRKTISATCRSDRLAPRGGKVTVETPRKIGNREVEEKTLVIRGRKFTLLTPKFIEEYIDPQDPLHDFPLWAKAWEASWVLADFLAGLPAEPGKRLLEIGCGLGLVGVVAATFGHNIIMTEHNPDAIEFARTNAEINHCADTKIIDLDWTAPALHSRFDYIVGSEVVYHEKDFEPLRNLFERLLKPGGEVILCEGIRRTSLDFFKEMQRHFDLKAQQKSIRSPEKTVLVILCRMKPKIKG